MFFLLHIICLIYSGFIVVNYWSRGFFFPVAVCLVSVLISNVTNSIIFSKTKGFSLLRKIKINLGASSHADFLGELCSVLLIE